MMLPEQQHPSHFHKRKEETFQVLHGELKIEIDGQRFVRRGAWGHLLNEHHLYPIDDYLYPRDAASETTDPYPPLYRSSRATPRLYRYFHGKRPRALAR